MNLNQISQAIALRQPNHSILIYGPPKSGKSVLAGTAAKIPEIKTIYYFSLENGHEAIIHSGLSVPEMEKITVYNLPDTRENPIAIETMLRAFSSRTPINICDAHGKVDCVECKKSGATTTQFCLAQCTHDDLVVVDSGSQLGDSALNAACKSKPLEYKPGWDEYGLQGKWLGDLLSVVQQAQYTNFVVLTHEISLEGEDGKDRMFPLMGSKQFCLKVAKYFGTVAYTHMKLNKHVAGSSSTYRTDVLTGSRVNARLEDSKTPSMEEILIKGGILKRASNLTSITK